METSDARRLNEGLILRAVATRKEATRQQIIDDTGLSRATVSRLVRQLVSAGLIIEDRSVSGPGGGRPAEILVSKGVSDVVCGIDMGGTNTRFILASQGAHLIASWRDQTAQARSGAGLAAWLNREVNKTCQRLGASMPTITVVGIPGTVEQATGLIRNAPNLPQIEGGSFHRALAKLTVGDLVVENDSNLALVGEMRAGAAANADNAVMITIGTGVGAGVALDRRVLTGSSGTVGEFGVIPVDLKGTTLESVISGPGIAAEAARHRLRDTRPQAVLLATGDGGRARVRDRVLDALFALMVTLSVAYEPSVVVVGGGVAASLEGLLDGLQERLSAVVQPSPRLVTSALGDPAGAVGAIARGLEVAHEALGAGLTLEQDIRLSADVASIVAQLSNCQDADRVPGTSAYEAQPV